MVRIQVRLTKEQTQALKKMAADQHVSVAELIRRSVDMMIRSSMQGTRDERWQRAVAIAGPFHSGYSDISVRHDDYLAEDFLA